MAGCQVALTVEHAVVGLHVHEQGGHHADGLLAGDAADLVLSLHKRKHLLEEGELAQLGGGRGVGAGVRTPKRLLQWVHSHVLTWQVLSG